MAEKIKLLEADIDFEKLLKKGAEAKKSIEFLKTEVKFFQNSIKEGKGFIETYQDSLAKMEKQGKQNTKEYQVQEKNLKSLVKSQESNRQKLELVETNLRKQQKQYRLTKKGIDSYNKTVLEEIKIIEKTDGSITQLEHALAENRKAYRELTKEQRENVEIGGKLFKTISQQDQEYKELQKSIGTTQVDVGNYKGQIKELLDENVNLSKTFKQQLEQIPLIGGVLGGVYGILLKYISGQRAAIASTNGGTKALEIFRLALINMGIGAIVVLLGLLVSGFLKSQKAIDFFNQKLAGVKAVIGVITDVFAAFADVIIDVFNAPASAWDSFINKMDKGWKFVKGQVIDRFLANWRILKNSFLASILRMRIAWNEFTGDSEEAQELRNELEKINEETKQSVETIRNLNNQAIETFNNAVNGAIDFAKELENARQKGELLEKQLQQIKKEEILLDIQRSASKKTLKELNKTIEDVTKGDNKRINAAKESQQIQEDILRKSVELGKRRLAQLLGETKGYTSEIDKVVKKFEEGTISVDEALGSLGIDRSNVEDLEKFRDVFSQIQDKQSEFLELQTTTQNKVNTIIQQGSQKAIAANQRRVDAAIKESKTLLDIYIAEQGVKSKTLQEELNLAEKIKAKRIKILQEELKAKKITQSEYNLALIEIDNDLARRRAEIAVDNAARELENFKSLHQSKLEANQFLTDELLNQEIERLDLIAQKEREYHEARLEQGIINQQEYHDAINEVDEQNRISKKELEEERKEAKKEEEAAEFEIARLEDEEKFNNQFDIEIARLEAEKERDVKAAKGNKKLIEKIEKESAKNIKKIQEEKEKARLQQASNTLGGIAQLLGEHTAAGKAAGIAQATINTYQGVTEVWKAPSVLPEPFNTASKVAATGVTLASGLATVKKITSVKAEKGAVFDIGGKRHSQGGTKFFGEDGTAFEAELGEKMFVLSRRASAAIAPLLNDINQQYGGASLLSGSSTYLASGGAILRGSSQVSSQQVQGQNIDSSALKDAVYQGSKEGIAEANIMVAVEDINTGQGNFVDVVNGANIGG